MESALEKLLAKLPLAGLRRAQEFVNSLVTKVTAETPEAKAAREATEQANRQRAEAEERQRAELANAKAETEKANAKAEVERVNAEKAKDALARRHFDELANAVASRDDVAGTGIQIGFDSADAKEMRGNARYGKKSA